MPEVKTAVGKIESWKGSEIQQLLCFADYNCI